MQTVLVCSIDIIVVSLLLGFAKDGGEGEEEQRGGTKT